MEWHGIFVKKSLPKNYENMVLDVIDRYKIKKCPRRSYGQFLSLKFHTGIDNTKKSFWGMKVDSGSTAIVFGQI